MNLFLTDEGVIKLGDFGVSRQMSEKTLCLHSFYGTPLYFSPEIIEGRPYSHSTDLWSLGVLLRRLGRMGKLRRAQHWSPATKAPDEPEKTPEGDLLVRVRRPSSAKEARALPKPPQRHELFAFVQGQGQGQPQQPQGQLAAGAQTRNAREERYERRRQAHFQSESSQSDETEAQMQDQLLYDDEQLSGFHMPVDLHLLILPFSIPDGQTQMEFLEAARRGTDSLLEDVLKKAVDPNLPRDVTNAPALQLAALHGQMTSVQLLLEADAQVDKADHEGKSPLLVAANKGHLDTVRLLLAHGAEVNRANCNENAPLWVASWKGHLEVVKLLLKANAQCNKMNHNMESPVWVACEQGHLEVSQVLIEARANLDLPAHNEISPLWVASWKGTYAGRFTPTLPGIYKLQVEQSVPGIFAEYWWHRNIHRNAPQQPERDSLRCDETDRIFFKTRFPFWFRK
eukprot:g26413.t1